MGPISVVVKGCRWGHSGNAELQTPFQKITRKTVGNPRKPADHAAAGVVRDGMDKTMQNLKRTAGEQRSIPVDLLRPPTD